MYRVALRLLGDEREAEDAAQDALLQAWRSMGEFRGDSAFSTWLYRIVSNRCLNVLRARRPLQTLDHDRPARDASVERTVEARLELGDVARAITQLTPEQRLPLVLREIEHCSHEEIAQILDVSVSAVKSRLHRARLELLNRTRGWQ